MLSLTQEYLDGLTATGMDLLRRNVRTEYRLPTDKAYTVFGRTHNPSISMHVRARVEHETMESDKVDLIAVAAAQEAAWLQEDSCAYVTINDPVYKFNMSRMHMCIRLLSGRYQVYDMGSTNGVVINGHRIKPRTWNVLAQGSLICFFSGSKVPKNEAPYAEYEFLIDGQKPRAQRKRKRQNLVAVEETKEEEEEDTAVLTEAQTAFEEDHCCIICQRLLLQATQPSCGRHTFCAGCLDNWLSTKSACPMCRQPHTGETLALPDVDANINAFVMEAYTAKQQLEHRQSRVADYYADPAPAPPSDDAIDAAALLVPEARFVRDRQYTQDLHHIHRTNSENALYGDWTLERAEVCDTVCRCCISMIDAGTWRLVCRRRDIEADEEEEVYPPPRPSFYHLDCSRAFGDAAQVHALHQRVQLPPQLAATGTTIDQLLLFSA